MFYPMPEDDFDEEILEEFVDEVLAGKATPYIKSEKVPKEQKDVVKVVGKTFNKIVNDDSKVTFIIIITFTIMIIIIIKGRFD